MDPPQDLTMDRSAIEEKARAGFTECQADLEKALSPDLYRELSAMFSGGAIDITADQWVTTVYDMIVAFKTAADRNALVESLKGDVSTLVMRAQFSEKMEASLRSTWQIDRLIHQEESSFSREATEQAMDSVGEKQRVDPIRRAGAKIGRNEPCPCGSGRKYKKCCGAKTRGRA